MPRRGAIFGPSIATRVRSWRAARRRSPPDAHGHRGRSHQRYGSEQGWHVQLNLRPELLVQLEDLLLRSPSPLVFDHLAHIPRDNGVEHTAFKTMRKLIDKGHTWVKLSGAYQDTTIGAPNYADATPIALAYVKAAPERMVWGSDWPHPTEKDKPDDAILFDLLSQWVPDEGTRNRIL